MKVYLANSLSNEADIAYNNHLAELIRGNIDNIDLYVPQENEDINDKGTYADSVMIARADYNELKSSDVLVAVLDNADNGVSFEAGIAFERGMPIIGLFTDVRQQGRDNEKKINALISDGTENQFIYHNLMEIGGIKIVGKIVDNKHDLVMELKKINENNNQGE